MTQKSAGTTANVFKLKGVSRQAKVGEMGVNFEEMAKPGQAKTMIPSFNQDRLFFTPAFFLIADQKYYSQNTTFEKFQFKEKVERSLHLVSQKDHPETLLLPAPNSNYCQVCRTQYDSYFSHIAQEDHIATTRLNPINKHIQDLEKSFLKKLSPIPKTKGIRKSLRSTKNEPVTSFSQKEEAILQGSECYPKSLNQSTAVRVKEDFSRVV